MNDLIVLIEADGQPPFQIVVEDPPIITFNLEGIQGPRGPAGGAVEPGDAIRVVDTVVHVDIDRLTLAP